MDHGDSKQSRAETSIVAQRRAMSLPSWLDGRTIAILASVVSLAAVNQTSYSRLGDDIHRLRDEMYAMRAELRTDIGALDERLRVVEIDLAAIRTHLLGFDVRPSRDKPQREPS